jgi:hypothetical protein
MADAWRAAQAAPAWMYPAMLLLPLGNWALTSAIFWILMRPHGRIGLWEMSALIGSAWVLNMLPLKPGFVGRVAYHKAISGVPIRTTLTVTLIALLSGSIGILVALSAQIALDRTLRAAVPTDRILPVAIGVLIVAAAVCTAIALCRGWRIIAAHAGGVAAAIVIRIADTHLWALRYWLAFGLIGQDQPYGVCVVVASVSQIAGQVPIQLGLREWSVGVSTTLLRGTGGPMGAAASPGILADLLCRASEVICAIPVGLVSYAWIYRRLGRGGIGAAKAGP